jgi:hypothetical protein
VPIKHEEIFDISVCDICIALNIDAPEHLEEVMNLHRRALVRVFQKYSGNEDW